jgi:hypothetical protein
MCGMKYHRYTGECERCGAILCFVNGETWKPLA